MSRHQVHLIWLGGAILAFIVYWIGPDRFLAICAGLFDGFDAFLHALLRNLGGQVFNVVRAAAIAGYIVFVILGLLAARRGLPAWWALTVITVLVLLLVYRPEALSPVGVGRWVVALVLVLIGGAVMTKRLTNPPPGRW